MIITPLWHTEFLVDIHNQDGENIRILVDAWFSDFAIGDLMERSVKVRLDPSRLTTLDAIYISHAHCDHLDPYTLTMIYAHASPLLILPVTLRYLAPLFAEFIPNASIKWLENHETLVLKGIEITGIMFDQDDITNEDDVMTLSIASDKEIAFAEIDTLPPDSLEAQRQLSKLFSKRHYETILYLASRNELEGNLKILDTHDVKSRDQFRREYLSERREEIEWWYAKWTYDEYADNPNFFTLPGFTRGFIGQGICYPYRLSPFLAEMSAFSLPEVVEREVSFATEYGYTFPQRALMPGRQFRVEWGVIEPGRKECPIGELMRNEASSHPSEGDVHLYASWPLFPRSHGDITRDQDRILHILNTRFLPYWSASSVASLRSALIASPDGTYRIECRRVDEASIVYEYSFATTGFVLCPYREDMRFDESYWLDDILDFLDGKQELYSNFWHRLDPKMIYRLWTCLGANFCNNDLVLIKYRLHFERAKQGETAESFFEAMKKSLIAKI